MGFTFVRLEKDKTVSTNGKYVFKKLIKSYSAPGSIDLRKLGLTPGAYIISVKSCATGLHDSDRSNRETCKINYR